MAPKKAAKGKGKEKAAAPKGKGKAPVEYTLLPESEREPSFYLSQLNENQRRAVEHPPTGGLQILAGPGSGKTKVLTTRVAHLINHFEIDPASIVVVTFTNKAAREMQKRLYALVGQEKASRLVMGTFHSICVMFLRRHYKLTSLDPQWSVVDSAQSDKFISAALKECKAAFGNDFDIKLKTAKNVISKAKSKNLTVEQFSANVHERDYGLSRSGRDYMPDVFERYQDQLKRNKALDFDDLLVYGYRLLKSNPETCKRFKAVLIDEFQDTSTLQYDIARCLASGSGHLTIVGDPDQSIYGWRQADIQNLYKMKKDFKGTTEIHLVHNYRSTGSIVGAALSIIEGDTNRIKKDLVPVHPIGSTVVHAECTDETAEATFIAEQILHLKAHSGNMLNWSDFAVLVRFHAQSRGLEAALVSRDIPYRVADGARFFDRIEIQDILAYLQLADNPHFSPAIERVINVPKRGIGDSTFDELQTTAIRWKKSVFDVACDIVNGTSSARVNTTVAAGLETFVKLIKSLQVEALQGKSVDALISLIFETLDYENYLDRTHGKGEERMRNVAELVRFAGNLTARHHQSSLVDGGVSPPADDAAQAAGEDDVPDPAAHESPLRIFLSSLALANGLETSEANENEETAEEKKKAGAVTILTGHSAKGLEWPVVFVPGVEDGKYPAFWTRGDPAAQDEERRLLYVAVTRAKSYCFIITCKTRTFRGYERPQKPSPYLATAKAKVAALFSGKMDRVTATVRQALSTQLARPVDESKVRQCLDDYAQARADRASPSQSPSRFSQKYLTQPQSPSTYRPVKSPTKPVLPWSLNGSSSSSAQANEAASQAEAPPLSSRQSQSQESLPSSINRPMADPFAAPLPQRSPSIADASAIPAASPTDSNLPSSSQSQGFRPARTFISRSGTSMDVAPPSPGASSSQGGLSRSNSTGFRPARQPSNLGTSSNLLMPETRASVISQAVLVNPEAPKPRGDLLASFQSAETDALAQMLQFPSQSHSGSASTNGNGAMSGHSEPMNRQVSTATSASGTRTAADEDDRESNASGENGRPKRKSKPKQVYDPTAAPAPKKRR